MEDISLAYEQIGGLIERLEISKDGTTDYLIDTDKKLTYIQQWTADHKGVLQPFRDARYQIKKKNDKFPKEEAQAELGKQLHCMRSTKGHWGANEAQNATTQKDIEQATIQQEQRQEEWYMRKLEFEKQVGESQAEHLGGAREFKNTCNIFNAVTEATKVYNYSLFRWLQRLVAFLESIYRIKSIHRINLRRGWFGDLGS